jgi:ABC-2 type transport system ATP-binding protein
VLAVEGLRKAYDDVVALDGVDLEAAPGQIVGLLGANGAGKTTLVSIVAGLRKADAGRVRVGDVDALAQPHRARELLGIAPQETGVYPTATARENLAYFGRLAGLRGKLLDQRVDEAAEALELHDLLDREAQTLSGGEQRRVHTAMAIVKRPPLVLLDEPTVGADVSTRAQLLVSVRTLAAEGAAVVYSTHYLPEIEILDADVTILDRGRVIARGKASALVDEHDADNLDDVFLELTGHAIDEADDEEGHVA